MALPFLPGYSFQKNLGKEKYHKSHHFDSQNGVAFMFGNDKNGIGGDPLPGQSYNAPHSQYPNGETSSQPAWVAFDKQVLCFDAYYQESVNERREEQFRVHQCKIYFYLEDDSIQVIEPRLKNSGLPQGTLIRRHRISRPAPNNSNFYTVDDFNVGVTVTLYDKMFKLTGCDQFTHNFLRKLGTRVGQPEHQPSDPHTSHRKALDESMQPLRPYERHDTLKQFLDHDRHVLRFYCFWDDTDSLYGDPRELILHYFLADDTIEIREVLDANCGRDAASCFLKRQKLAKYNSGSNLPGQLCDRTVLNVFGHIQSGRYILDNLKTGSVNIEYYKDNDLTVGSCINVYGRKFLIKDSDEFTKEYYRNKYGINEFKPINCDVPLGRPVERCNPPFNGWGSEEDSLGNCQKLIPKPPQRDFVKFMEKDRCGLESHVLRFSAHIDTDNAINKERKFIISYFLSDDTILVFEPAMRNSGIQGGKFLERSKVRIAGHERYGQQLPKYYQSNNFYVGAEVEINHFKFIIEDCDEYAYRYMESHPAEYPIADINKIMAKLRAKISSKGNELRSYCARNDPDGTNSIGFEQARNLLRQVGANLVDHEIVTLCRHYALRSEDGLSDKNVFGIAQSELRKNNFECFSKLSDTARHMDRDQKGRLMAEQMRVLGKTLRMPLPNDLLFAVMQLSGIDEDGSIDYAAFIRNLNWRENPIACAETGVDSNEDWYGTASHKKVERIMWQQLVDDVCGAGQ